jgi:hypothetical protein
MINTIIDNINYEKEGKAMKSMYCPHCQAYVGDCGHISGGYTGPSTLSGTCGTCEKSYSVTCNGDCLDKKSRGKKKELITIDLKISEDGHSIVDANGVEIARFREGLTVNLPKKSAQRLNGHMECVKECCTWDNQGKCIGYWTSCTWVFD